MYTAVFCTVLFQLDNLKNISLTVSEKNLFKVTFLCNLRPVSSILH